MTSLRLWSKLRSKWLSRVRTIPTERNLKTSNQKMELITAQVITSSLIFKSLLSNTGRGVNLKVFTKKLTKRNKHWTKWAYKCPIGTANPSQICRIQARLTLLRKLLRRHGKKSRGSLRWWQIQISQSLSRGSLSTNPRVLTKIWRIHLGKRKMEIWIKTSNCSRSKLLASPSITTQRQRIKGIKSLLTAFREAIFLFNHLK